MELPMNRILSTLEFYELGGQAYNLKEKIRLNSPDIVRYVEACLRTVRIRAAAMQITLNTEEAEVLEEYLESI